MLLKFVRSLTGYRTQIIATIGGVINFVNFLSQTGMFNLTIPHLAQINVVLAFLGLSALRAAVPKKVIAVVVPVDPLAPAPATPVVPVV